LRARRLCQLQRGDPVLGASLKQLLYPALGGAEELLAVLDQADTLFELLEGALQREVSRLEPLDHPFEAIHQLAVALGQRRLLLVLRGHPYPRIEAVKDEGSIEESFRER
jgi:hypothetical protein